MGRINDRQDTQDYRDALGMDATNYAANIPPGYVQLARNAVLSLSSGYSKRRGSANVLASPITHAITSGFSWYTPAGLRQVLLAGAGQLTFLNESLAPTSVTLGWDPAFRIGFVQPGLYPFLFNGDADPQVWNGTSLRPLGLAAPTTAPSLSAATGPGGLVDGGSYAYAYTYVIEGPDGQVVAESSPSSVVSFTATSSGAINVGYTDGPAQATHVYIYRTFTSAAQAFLLARIAVGSSSYEDLLADVALDTSRILELDNGQLEDYTSKARYPVVVANRVFVCTADNEVRYSKIGQSGAMYESFQATAFTPTAGVAGTSDRIVGLGAAGDVPIVLKSRSVGALDAIGVPDYGGGDPVLYAYRELTSSVGGLSHWAQCQVFGELLWLSNAGIFATDGRTVREVAPTLAALFRDVTLTSAQNTKVSAFNDIQERQVYFTFFKNLNDTTPTRVFVGDYRRYPTFRWTVWEPGENTTSYPGVRPGCFIGVPSLTRQEVKVWAGDARAAGYLLELNKGNTDIDNVAAVSKNIEFRLLTRAYDFGSPVNFKLFKGGLVTVGLEGGSLYVSAVADFNEATQAQEFTAAGATLLWDVSLWNSGPWGQSTDIHFEYDSHVKGRVVQLELTHFDPSDFFVQGWAAFASIEGAY